MKQIGFTLIELIIVIVILGILAATALPRFVDLTGDAARVKRDSLLGVMKAASAIAHATTLVKGNAAGEPISLEGREITMVNFYPTADPAGIVTAANLDPLNDGFTHIGGGTAGGSILTFVIEALSDCTITYQSPSRAGGAPVFGGDRSCTF